ncbi:MAG: tRNA (adenosine(37)-N6)-threonylcarbamoyltransferase complex dimerization subunit type 1 TsaB [Phycisphaerales bacterium]|nr:tRNA (adenosine(37)-N6)-threonylcarbamoyltransferase complex dimerization subunit type 1 TsaB [Phycisphaerales bacterium]
MKTPVLLAIECSQRKGGIALQDREGNIHQHHFENGARRDDVLQPAIESVFDVAGLQPEDLEGCGCSIGPGGFTGLRITIATVRACAMTLGIPVYGIPSAAVAAASTPQVAGPVLVALACKGDSLWLTRLEYPHQNDWIGTGGLVLAASISEHLHDATMLLADEHLPEAARETALGAGLPIVDPCFDPTSCLQITSLRHAAAMADDAMALGPLYPREPEAVTIFNARTPS